MVRVWAWACLGAWAAAAAADETSQVNPEYFLLPENLKVIFQLDQLVGETLRLLPRPTMDASRYLEWYRWRVVDAAGAGGDLVDAAGAGGDLVDAAGAGSDLVDEVITGNHLHVYFLLKRMALLWPSVRKALYELKGSGSCEDQLKYCAEWKEEGRCFQKPELMMTHCQRSCGGCQLTDRVEAIREAERDLLLPSVEALNLVAKALGVLQHVYNLNITSLVDGQIFTVVTSVRLSLWDCIRVARSSESQGKYSNAWVWYQQALTMTSDPDLSGYINDLVLSLTKLRSRDVLMCHVSALGSAFLLLQPAKQEILSLDPHIFMIHDAITNNQAYQLITLAKDEMDIDPKLERQDTIKLLKNNSHPVVKGISRLVTFFTGLQIDNAPVDIYGDTKIRQYGTGGHIGPHVDVRYKHGLPNKTEKYTLVGDRVLSCLFYLTDVVAGGSTNFYQLGLAIPPKKGTAILWYNLKKNGDYDHRLDHSGCPVLLGSKWVALKWVREHINFLTYPCSLYPNE